MRHLAQLARDVDTRQRATEFHQLALTLMSTNGDALATTRRCESLLAAFGLGVLNN